MTMARWYGTKRIGSRGYSSASRRIALDLLKEDTGANCAYICGTSVQGQMDRREDGIWIKTTFCMIRLSRK